jgi:hypothetical protein
MQISDPKKVTALRGEHGETVYAVDNGKGGFELTDTIELRRQRPGSKSKRKLQKQARKRQRK